MARLLILSVLILALGAAACSALVSFDASKIPKDHNEGAAGAPSILVDAGGTRCAPGSAGNPCVPCQPGEYCGGGAVALSCPKGQWDHDRNPATPCLPQRDCPAGEFVSSEGSSTE